MKPRILALGAVLMTACAENPPPRNASAPEPTASTSTVDERTTTRVDMQSADSSPHRDETARAANTDPRRASDEQSAARSPEIATTPPSSYSVTPPPAPQATEPDNTRANARDRSGETRTPIDQGNSATDLRLTQDIRRALMNEGGLSFTAKNVKVITLNEKVTLRGPVKSEAEHTIIVADARRIAGADNVDDQLEVASK